MIRLNDNKSSLYQWDLDQKVIVESNVEYVNFNNINSSHALVCEVYQEGENYVADIPNILLQESLTIYVYCCCDSCTKESAIIKVIPRSQPSDYVYTPTEVHSWEQLDARITSLEENPSGVSDVKLNDTSIVVDGVANIPVSAEGTLGLVKMISNSGLYATSSGTLTINKATNSEIDSKTSSFKPIVPNNLNYAVKSVLTSISGYDSTQTQVLKNVNGALQWVTE